MTLHTMRLKKPVSSLRLSPNGGVLCALTLGDISVFQVDFGNLKSLKLGRSWEVGNLKFLHQICFFGKKVVFGGAGKVVVFDI